MGISSDTGGGMVPGSNRSTRDSRMASEREPASSANSSQQSSDSFGNILSLMAIRCTEPKLPTRYSTSGPAYGA